MRFPEKIPLPVEVEDRRIERRRQIMSTSLRGVLLRSSIVLAELWGFFWLGSQSLLLDALASLLDIGGSLLLLLCIKVADRPPDRNHPLGHGRFEPIAGLQLGIFLVLIGAVLGIRQCLSFSFEAQKSTIHPYAFLIPLVAVVLLEIAYQHLRRIAKKQHSPALLADAVHYRVDSVSSLFAVVALSFGVYFPQYSLLLDHVGAFFIALLMIGIGVHAGLENLHQILDRAPPASYFQVVEAAALRVPGVLGTEKVRIQSYGPDAHVSIDIEVDPSLSVEVAHRITQEVRCEIQKSWPSVRDVIVHVEPYYENDHEPREWT